ncbi:MAG: hypothetical protein GKS00_02050 [Alphaproteobacteria bacterium]|nr:hypothetical protein [Alphaproteobacteria bacterium]
MTRLTDRAMLAGLTITQWSARKHDKRVSDQVARDHDAGANAGRYNKTLIAGEALKEIGSIAGEARGHHYTNTLPWADNGTRILPAANYWDYTREQRAFKERFQGAAARFRESYPHYVAEARTRLNTLFRADDYPDPADLATRFHYENAFTPLPTADDFRVSLGEVEEARIRADIEQRLGDATQAAMRDLWDRVYDAVSHMRDRLDRYEVHPVSGKVQHPFRDTLVGNLRDLAELLPRLNVTGDAALDAMRHRLAESLCVHDAQDLRDDDALREQTARTAGDILADMAGYAAPAAAAE